MKSKVYDDQEEILIVEDSPTQAELLKFLLEKNNYHVSVAYSGNEALAMLINKRKPTIVISDIIMPEMDGYQLCRNIKRNESLKDIPVILLTTLSNPRDILKGIECGADSFITKPYDEKYLLSRIQYILANISLFDGGNVHKGTEIFFEGQKYSITSEHKQILNLLLSTYEAAVQKNYELLSVQDELRRLNEQLEKKVEERTADLKVEIEERKRVENELKQKAVELARSNAELELFAYFASHDLQEPLRMVGSFVQLLARRYKGKLDANADDFIAYAVDGVTRMQGMINDLLAYSRVGRQGNPFKPTDYESVLRLALINLQIAIEESGAVITHDSMPTVTVDASQQVQLLQNLIGNAIKFRREEPSCIHISVKQEENESVFSIRDNGIGIEPGYHDRIFMIFQRLHGREYPGSGIGLAICKKIVERHSGRIWAESQPGKGSTFYYTIPKIEIK